MKVTFTHPALRSLKRLYDYRKGMSGIEAARRFRKTIFDSVIPLKDFPRLGKLEESLVDQKYEYRYMLATGCKIVYRIEDAEIFVVEIFDTRQDPEKLIF